MWTPRLPLLGVKLSPQSHTAPLHVLVVLFGQSLHGNLVPLSCPVSHINWTIPWGAGHCSSLTCDAFRWRSSGKSFRILLAEPVAKVVKGAFFPNTCTRSPSDGLLLTRYTLRAIATNATIATLQIGNLVSCSRDCHSVALFCHLLNAVLALQGVDQPLIPVNVLPVLGLLEAKR